MWKDFEQPCDIGEVFLPLAAAARFVRHRPDLSLKDIFNPGHRKRDSENLTRGRALDERLVSRIRLNLHPEIAAAHQFPTGISPDGTRIVFGENTTSRDLMILTLPGTRKGQPLLTSMFVEWNGDVSADGRWLAYQSDASGRFEIYVRPFPDVGGGQWQISTMGGEEPLWARDGRELFYRGPDGAVMRVPIDADKAWKAGTPAQVLRAGYYEGDSVTLLQRTYDISPDGRRFVMIKEGTVPVDAAQTARITSSRTG